MRIVRFKPLATSARTAHCHRSFIERQTAMETRIQGVIHQVNTIEPHFFCAYLTRLKYYEFNDF